MQARFYESFLPYLLARAALPVSRRFYARLKLGGMPMTRWRLLGVLLDGRSMPVTELANEITVTQSTATRLIDRAAKAGLVVKKTNGVDRRSIVVTITPRGRDYIRDVAERAVTADREVCAELPAPLVASLKENLRTLIDLMSRAAPEHAPARPAPRRKPRAARNARPRGAPAQGESKRT